MKYALCYDSLDVFNNIKELKDHFTICYYSSEGAEQQRYASILINSDIEKIARDGVSDYCNNIHLKNYQGQNIHISLNESMNLQETVKYFENIIKPIIDVCIDYDVNFKNDIPFEDFGSDIDSAYGNMISISNFYKDILDKFDIRVESIETKDKSDGKYLITINNKEFDMNARDKLESIIDNVESMLETFKEKEVELS